MPLARPARLRHRSARWQSRRASRCCRHALARPGAASGSRGDAESCAAAPGPAYGGPLTGSLASFARRMRVVRYGFYSFLALCVAHCLAHYNITIGASPLYRAVERGDTAQLITLLNAGVDVDTGMILGPLFAESPLHVAVGKGSFQHVSALLKAGAHVYAGGTFGPTGVFGFSSPLQIAATYGHVDIVRELLKAGAKADKKGNTLGPFGLFASNVPLLSAANRGHADVVRELLQAPGAKVGTARATIGPFGMFSSWTPLFAAAGSGYADIVRELIRAGANPDTPTTLGPFGMLSSQTPLFAAALEGHADVVRELLKAAGTSAKVDAGKRSYCGLVRESPLKAAERRGHHDVAKLLREHQQLNAAQLLRLPRPASGDL